MANSALTLACLAPGRSSWASARPPRARPSASSRIDLPAPVSPVSTERPGSISRSRRSMRTTSRIDRFSSIAARRRASQHTSEDGVEPGAFLPHRLQVLAGQQIVAVLVPVAAGVVVAEHGRGGLRLVLDADRQVALGQALERLRNVGRGLVELDDAAEAVDGGEVLLALEVEAADLHFLAGEVVAGEVELQRRIARVVGVGEAGDDVVEGIERLLGVLLVAADVDDLLVIADGLEIVGIGDALVAGMEVDEAAERDERIVVLVLQVVGIGRH